MFDSLISLLLLGFLIGAVALTAFVVSHDGGSRRRERAPGPGDAHGTPWMATSDAGCDAGGGDCGGGGGDGD